MKRYLILGVILSVWSSVCLARTWGADFIINNNSNLQMNRTDSQSNKMAKWDFPQNIPVHQSIQTHIEFESNWFTTDKDDFGSVSYQVTCPSGTQTLTAQAIIDQHLLGLIAMPYYLVKSTGANCITTLPIANGEKNPLQVPLTGSNIITIN
jgi:hypothetical protein